MVETGFEITDHTADAGIKAYGPTLTAAFVNAARAMYSLITDIDKIKENLFREVEITAPDREALLVEWLNELIYLFDTEQLIFRRFDIEVLTENRLKAYCYGEKVDKTRHELLRGIKSATYHMVKIQKNQQYEIEVLLDI